MLTRSSQIGEFYIMMPPQIPPKDGGLHTADMMIYDEESDKHVRITWREALKATLANELDDNKGVSMGHSGKLKLSDWREKAELIAQFSEGKSPQLDEQGNPIKDKDGNPVMTGDPPTYDELQKAGCLDVRIVVARPFIEHLMHNAILAVSGRETGATLFGPADMQLSVSQSATRT